MLLMHAGLLVLIDFADLSVAMIVVQLVTFDREWLQVLSRDCKSRAKRRQQLAIDAAQLVETPLAGEALVTADEVLRCGRR